jgi:hypothetical protein
LWCRKAEQTREDRDGDIEKLFQFFRECKQNNEAFYWDVDFDPKTKVLRSIFWSHASQCAEYVDFGDVITRDGNGCPQPANPWVFALLGCGRGSISRPMGLSMG